MGDYTVDQYTLQSYFKSLCDSFYIVYRQLKRLEKQEEYLEQTNPEDDLAAIKALLAIPEENEICKKYVTEKYSKEQLEEEKRKLESILEEYNIKKNKLKTSKRDVEKAYSFIREAVASAIYTIANHNFTIIVTSEKEIIAFMYFFRANEVSKYRVINIKEEYLREFPSDKEMYKEFYAAYCTCNSEVMKEVCRKYY